MRLVQHDYDAELVLAGQFLDVLADAAMKRGKAGVRLQSHPDRDLAVEVAAALGGGGGRAEGEGSLGGGLLPRLPQTGPRTTRGPRDDRAGSALAWRPRRPCGLPRPL